MSFSHKLSLFKLRIKNVRQRSMTELYSDTIIKWMILSDINAIEKLDFSKVQTTIIWTSSSSRRSRVWLKVDTICFTCRSHSLIDVVL